jgi:hypothetical protein
MKTVSQTFKFALAIVVLFAITQLASCKKEENDPKDKREIKIKFYKHPSLEDNKPSTITLEILDPMTGQLKPGTSINLYDDTDTNLCLNAYTVTETELSLGVAYKVKATYALKEPLEYTLTFEERSAIEIDKDLKSGCYKVYLKGADDHQVTLNIVK